MKIKELKEELKKINPEATIILTVGNEDKDIFSSSEWEIHGDYDNEYIEFFMGEDATQQL